MGDPAAPLRTWLVEPLPEDVASALARLRRIEDVALVAAMPDVHLARGVCVGTVLATRSGLFRRSARAPTARAA
jgi:tRNA-splicing ligase RtcB (3'-phosphate/5'-hydroxy nucleic acid ligase)